MSKDSARRRARIGAAIYREQVALEMWAAGRRNVEIAASIDVHPSSVDRIVARGLARRAEAEGPTVEAARELYLEQLRQLVAAHWPLATGTYRMPGADPDVPSPPPDVRSAEFVLKVVDKMAAVTAQGLASATRTGEGEVHLHVDIGQLDKQREQVLASLATVRDKGAIIDAELAEAGTDLDRLSGRKAIDDRPAPPPKKEQAA